MRAPIFDSGSITRRIGRFDSDSSPISVESNDWPASNPVSRRMPVPALPQSIGARGRLQPVQADAVHDALAVARRFDAHAHLRERARGRARVLAFEKSA